MRDIIAPVSEMRKLKSGAKQSQNGIDPGLSASEVHCFLMLPLLVEGLRVTLEKGSQDQDFTQVRFTLTQAQGGLTIDKGGRPTDSGW